MTAFEPALYAPGAQQSQSTSRPRFKPAAWILSALLAACCALGAASADAATSGAQPPAQVLAAGYRTETFATVANFSKSTVDTGLTGAPGYKWYFYNFFGTPATSSLASFNSDGSVTIGTIPPGEGALSSVTLISKAPYYRGTAFGGGAYFEAVLSFNPSAVNVNTGWPAWWTYSLEHVLGSSGELWAGQASGYDHFAEPDIFEADLGSSYPHAYGGALHDWYGVYNKTCPGGAGYCNVQLPFTTMVRTVPSSTNFAQYHRYGLLWIPATATTKGSFTYFFDGAQVGQSTVYSQLTNQAPVPSASTPWTYAVADKQHLILILNSGQSTPMQVQSVTVWQASTTNNMTN